VTISYAEPTRLTCPRCGSPFDAEVWTLIDSAERPDLRDALLGDALNLVTCPHCGERGPAGGPLLLHDPSARRVYFAVPEDVDEPIWRDHAQALLYALVGALPEETRLPYLGDVQVEWGIAGLRRALARNQRRDSGVRRREAPAAPAAPLASVDPKPSAAPPAAAYAGSPLLDWVQVLLSADTPAEFHAVVREHPQLLDEGATALLDALMGEAQQLGEHEAAKAIQRTRQMLADLRASGEQPGASQVAAPPEPAAAPPLAPAAERALSDNAYQALLSTASSEDILDAAREHPALLEPWAEAALIAQAEAALESGGERIALLLDERIAALAEIRSALGAEAALLAAIRSLLAAESEEAIARAINAAGDAQLSTYASECRAMLREVRRGLDAQI
jgi:CpXC protein